MGWSLGELGRRLGLSGFGLDSASNDELESSLKGAGSGPEGGVLVEIGRVVVAGAQVS